MYERLFYKDQKEIGDFTDLLEKLGKSDELKKDTHFLNTLFWYICHVACINPDEIEINIKRGQLCIILNEIKQLLKDKFSENLEFERNKNLWDELKKY